MSGARDQVNRLLALAPYLQARRSGHSGGVRLARVAADFGVSTEQIVKDLRVLFMCGLPGLGPGDLVEVDFEAFEDDPEGIVRIDNADFLARPVRLGSTEASALLVALRALRESAPESSREVIDRALTKLENATTGDTPTPVEIQEAPSSVLTDRTALGLERAIAEDRQVRLRYYVPTREETTERVVDPLALLTQDGHAYLDAWCHNAQARRLFRLDRIQHSELLDERRVPHDVPPRDLSEGLFESSPDDLVARVHLTRRARWFADYYPVTSTQEADDGGLDVTLGIGDPQWLVRLVLRLAPDVVVAGPPELREFVERARRTVLTQYETPHEG